MKYAIKVHILQSFVTDIVSQICNSVPVNGQSSLPLTYQAFANSVSYFLTMFKKFLKEIEETVMKEGEDFFSIIRLQSKTHFEWLFYEYQKTNRAWFVKALIEG